MATGIGNPSGITEREWNSRPECSHVLNSYIEWSIDRHIIRKYENFDLYLAHFRELDCQLFYNYLSFKAKKSDYIDYSHVSSAWNAS